MKACIHCGMCLPACPTYLETGNEGNSPRGRLYLIKDFLDSEKLIESGDLVIDEKSIAEHDCLSSVEIKDGHLRLNEKAIEYLDSCLYCKACETACPSGVEYGDILEYARSEKIQTKYALGFKAWLRRYAFENILPDRACLNFLRFCYVPINAIYKLIPSLPKLSKVQPSFEHKYLPFEEGKIYYSSVSTEDLRAYWDTEDIPGDHERTISMPLGCVMDTLYNHVHWDTLKVLNAYGYHVYIPESQCCGALAHHSGESKIGHKQLLDIKEVFIKDKYPIVYNSAGCGSFVKDHSEGIVIKDLIEALIDAPFKPKLNPISNKLVKGISEDEILDQNQKLKAANKITATYHPACHLNHAQGIKTEYQEFLNEIPDLELVPLEEADICCGSAGFYNIIKDNMAAKIGERKAKFIENTEAKVLITANPGCMSQIKGHLPSDYEVLHPVTLLAMAI